MVVFSFIFLNQFICWSFALYFSIRLYCKVPKNSSFLACVIELLFHSLRVFHTRCVTERTFLSILVYLHYEWSRFFLWFTVPPLFCLSLLRPFQVCHQQLISPSLSYPTIVLFLKQNLRFFPSFRFILFPPCDSPKWQNPPWQVYLFFFQQINTISDLLIGIRFGLFRFISLFNPIYLTPPLGQDMIQGQFFKRSLAGLNSEFSF